MPDAAPEQASADEQRAMMPAFFGQITPHAHKVAFNRDESLVHVQFLWPDSALTIELEAGESVQQLCESILSANKKAKSRIAVAPAGAEHETAKRLKEITDAPGP